MTIAIAIAVPEGLVLAGDSRLTYPNPKGWPKIASDYAEKVYHVSPKVGAATFGWGMLNGRTIKSHIIDLSVELKEAHVGEVATRFATYFGEQYEAHVRTEPKEKKKGTSIAFGFLIAGYNNEGVGEVREILLPGNPRPDAQCTTLSPGAVWQGQVDIITRLLKGYDLRLNLSKVPKDAMASLQKALAGCEYVIYFARMVLQDAVDLAIFLAHTTIQTQRFTDGIYSLPGDVPGVGGAIDVAVITREYDIRWIQKKLLVGEPGQP